MQPNLQNDVQDSDQPMPPHSLIISCKETQSSWLQRGQTTKILTIYVQSDLRLRSEQMSFCKFCCVLPHLQKATVCVRYVKEYKTTHL